MGTTKMYLMSIRPKYATKILRGEKKFELRKLVFKPIERGSIVVVYASGNIKAIIGEFRAGRVIEGAVSELRRVLSRFGPTGVDREDWSYVEGARKAMAIEVLEPKFYYRRIRLKDLRRIIPGFNPPMSYRELSVDEPLYKLVISKLRGERSV